MKRIRPIQDVKIIVKHTGSNTLNIIEELGKKTIIDNGEKILWSMFVIFE